MDRFKLYSTDNIYTFLKLDTATGKIDQLQWSLIAAGCAAQTKRGVDSLA